MPIDAWTYILTCWLCHQKVAIAAEPGVNPDAAPAFIYGRCPKCGAEVNLTPGLLEPADGNTLG